MSHRSFFVTCAPGIEPLLHAELKGLRLSRLESQVGGMYFEGSLADALRVNLQARTAVRVLMRLARFPAATEDELYAGAQSIDWSPFLSPEGSFVVDAHSNASALDHTLFIEQRVKDAIVDAFRDAHGRRPRVDKEAPELLVHTHIYKDRCSLLVDTSGESLHKRGWRRFQGRAPLAETLAAAIVLDSQWDQRSPLMDPFAGSGTLLVEAAMLACRIAPGLLRPAFALERWRDWDPRAGAELRAQARAERIPIGKRVLLGLETEPETLRGARENLAALGLEDAIRWEHGRAESYAYKRGWNAWIVTNPPYGERIGDEDALARTYRTLGRQWKESCAGWHASLFTGNPRLAECLELRPVRRRALLNGALSCELLHYEL
jgi:23S rRNA G2445 N2-methylase RlmL